MSSFVAFMVQSMFWYLTFTLHLSLAWGALCHSWAEDFFVNKNKKICLFKSNDKRLGVITMSKCWLCYITKFQRVSQEKSGKLLEIRNAESSSTKIVFITLSIVKAWEQLPHLQGKHMLAFLWRLFFSSRFQLISKQAQDKNERNSITSST